MSEITPKTTLLKDAIQVKDHRAIVDAQQFDKSATITLAEIARLNISSEMMRGANLFLDTFLNLAEPISESPKPFPHKHLTYSSDTPEKKSP